MGRTCCGLQIWLKRAQQRLTYERQLKAEGILSPPHKMYTNLYYHNIVKWVFKLILNAILTKPNFLKSSIFSGHSIERTNRLVSNVLKIKISVLSWIFPFGAARFTLYPFCTAETWEADLYP